METSNAKKVLWVEDDTLLGKILGGAINTQGFHLELALTGKGALAMLKDFVPDVIMVDLYLPGEMNGYDVLEQVALDPRLKNIPTIILSNFGKAEHFGKEYSIVPTKYLLKADVSVAQIIQTLRELCTH